MEGSLRGFKGGKDVGSGSSSTVSDNVGPVECIVDVRIHGRRWWRYDRRDQNLLSF